MGENSRQIWKLCPKSRVFKPKLLPLLPFPNSPSPGWKKWEKYGLKRRKSGKNSGNSAVEELWKFPRAFKVEFCPFRALDPPLGPSSPKSYPSFLEFGPFPGGFSAKILRSSRNFHSQPGPGWVRDPEIPKIPGSHQDLLLWAPGGWNSSFSLDLNIPLFPQTPWVLIRSFNCFIKIHFFSN